LILKKAEPQIRANKNNKHISLVFASFISSIDCIYV
jgi:hypothetical protein